MSIAGQPTTPITRHRKNLQRLVGELMKRPLGILPERSVECLEQFFTGYGIFGPPVWRDLTGFEHWLRDRLFYPQDGARWWRFIELNSKDSCDSFDNFCRLYSKYARQAPIEIEPMAPNEIEPMASDHSFDHAPYDFYLHLYAISRKPGLYLGAANRVQPIAAYLAGYFSGKKDAQLKLTRDEREFFRFEDWLRRHNNCDKRHSWYRLVEMWGYGGLNSLQGFFAYYDAYLTNFGKKARGLEDLFESVCERHQTTIRRRKKMPKRLTRNPESRLWCRVEPRNT